MTMHSKIINYILSAAFMKKRLKPDSPPLETAAANAALGGLYCQKRDWHNALCRYAAWYVRNIDIDIENTKANKLIFRYVINRFIASVTRRLASSDQIKSAKIVLASVLAKLSSHRE